MNHDRKSMIEYDAAMKRLCGDHELFMEFVEIFLEDAPAHLAKFDAAFQTKNAQQVRRSAHALKGLASNFGAKDFCLAAQAIEVNASAGELDQCYDQQEEFTSLLERLTVELEKHRQTG